MYHPLNLTLDLYLQRMAAAGEFDHLEGEGKPLDLSPGGPGVMEKLLQEADVKPVIVVLQQKSTHLRSLLKNEGNPDGRRKIQRELADIHTRLAMEIEAWRAFD